MQISFPFHYYLCCFLLHPDLHSPVQQEECWILFLPKWGKHTESPGITLAHGDAKLSEHDNYENQGCIFLICIYMMVTELQNPFSWKTPSWSLSPNSDQSLPYPPAQSTECHVQPCYEGQKCVTLLFYNKNCEFSSPLEILSMQLRKCKANSFIQELIWEPPWNAFPVVSSEVLWWGFLVSLLWQDRGRAVWPLSPVPCSPKE